MAVLNISGGKIQRAQKVLIYGPEGIGKSTLLAAFPGVVFLDTEPNYGTAHLDVQRFPEVTSWTQLLQFINTLVDDQVQFTGGDKPRTLAVDTLDWAEKLCIKHVLAKFNKNGIEDFGYGKGYTYVAEEWGRFLNLLQEVVNHGTNVAMAAHAIMRRTDAPGQTDSYDRWELKLIKQTGPMTKEWVDALLFCNYKIITETVSNTNRVVARGGKRVIYTNHNPSWDAKNRWGLDDELPMGFVSFGSHIPGSPVVTTQSSVPPFNYEEAVQKYGEPGGKKPEPEPEQMTMNRETEPEEDHTYDGLPKELVDLMKMDNIVPEDIQEAVAGKGYYPKDTPITSYDPDFVAGVLIGAWDQIRAVIKAQK